MGKTPTLYSRPRWCCCAVFIRRSMAFSNDGVPGADWTKVGDVTQKQLSSRNIAHESSSLASTTTPASPSPPPTPRRPSLLRASSSRRSCSLLSPLSARRQSSDATRLLGTTEERPTVSWEDHSSTASSGAGQQLARSSSSDNPRGWNFCKVSNGGTWNGKRPRLPKSLPFPL